MREKERWTHSVMSAVDGDITRELLSVVKRKTAVTFLARPRPILERVTDDSVLVESRVEVQSCIGLTHGGTATQQVDRKPFQ